MNVFRFIAPGMLAMVYSCNASVQSESPENATIMRDPHSYAHTEEVVVTHLEWDAAVNFETKRITATATWNLDNKTGANQLILDIRDLDIHSVLLDGTQPAKFVVGKNTPNRPYLGQPLTIDITPATKTVSIQYSTASDAAALQWLDAAQTKDKKYPFLFTQSQAILARTWIPCQDGPGVRFTYNAKVQVPSGMMALMSAENPQTVSNDGLYTFRMEQRIPSYLMALAVGDFAFQSIGRNTGVYAEPSYVAACAWELVDMQNMLDKAEELYGEYAWGRYDVLVLPPSFPFGGMENPRITFATPTIIAGDRSLTALVAHELAHSWSGNLVTNANWNDFWMNEGFTVYFENRIMEAVYGVEYADMLKVLEYNDVTATIEEYGKDSPDTYLKLQLSERDPDDGMSDIAYNKGAYFLRLLESKVGREKFDVFLHTYFTSHAFQVMDTETFVKYLNKELIEPNKAAFEGVDINEWIYGPGMPANCPIVVSERFNKVDSAVAAFIGGEPAKQLATSTWSTHEWLRFIRSLPEDVSLEKMAELDAAFAFTGIGNSEIADVWYELAINRGYSKAYPAIDTFLCSVGRRKFLTPLYKAMIQTEEGKAMAKEIYAKARPTYHYVAVTTLDALLEWK